MPQTHRLNDCNDGGGCVTVIPQTTIFVNNLLQVVDGSMGTGHGVDPHCELCWVTIQNTVKEPTNVFVENIPAGYRSNVDSCGHARAEGSPNVFINSFGESGALIDNNVPYLVSFDPIPPGAQPSPPAPYAENTPADVAAFENDDPDDTPVGPPPDTEERPVENIEEDPEPPEPPPPPIPVDCDDIDALPDSFTWTSVSGSFASYAAGVQLSPNYTLADLTINTAVSHYPFTTSPTQASGASQKQIMQNLCYLAQTVLEPMRAQYGPFTVTSAFRNKSGGSQHNRGQAADIQFLGFHGTGQTGSQYFGRAQEIRDDQQYDQLILEWYGRNPWIHVSSNSAGARRQVLTQTSPTGFSPGLTQLRP